MVVEIIYFSFFKYIDASCDARELREIYLNCLPQTGVSCASVTHTAVSGCVFRRQSFRAEGRDTGARCSQLCRPFADLEHEEDGCL